MTAAQQQLERAPWTIWVDTCSLIDFDTTISLVKNASRGQVASTRVLMRDAAWMGVALVRRGPASVSDAVRSGIADAPRQTRGPR
jgi:hypothetical protein